MNTTKTAVKNILIVEDDYDMRQLYQLFFKGLEDRYVITMEDKAEQALRMLANKHFDLIILDIIMEPLPGDTFFICARSYKKTMFLPILVVSVLSPSVLLNLKKINHAEFIQKPVTQEALMHKIKEMIG
ncbi:response regulator [Candidatus Omnitrophota bacterium]